MDDIFLAQPGPLARVGWALRDRLQLAFPPEKFVFQWMPSRIDREVWQKLTQRVPMIGIGFTRFNRLQTSSALNVLSEWMVYLVTKNERSAEAVLFGDTLAPGQLVLAEVGAAILHGFTIPGIGTIQVSDASNAFIEDYKENGLAITAIEVTVPVDLSLGNVIGGEATKAAWLAGQTVTWEFGGATVTDVITNAGTS